MPSWVVPEDISICSRPPFAWRRAAAWERHVKLESGPLVLDWSGLPHQLLNLSFSATAKWRRDKRCTPRDTKHSIPRYVFIRSQWKEAWFESLFFSLTTTATCFREVQFTQFIKFRNKRLIAPLRVNLDKSCARDGVFTLVVNCVAVHWCDKTSRVDHSIGLLASCTRLKKESPRQTPPAAPPSSNEPAAEICKSGLTSVWGAFLIRPWKLRTDDRDTVTRTITDNSACCLFNSEVQRKTQPASLLVLSAPLTGWQTVSEKGGGASGVGLQIPVCVKKEMWKQLWEECHLCPASPRACCGISEQRLQQLTDTRFSHYVLNLIEIGLLKVDPHLCLRAHLDGIWTHGVIVSRAEPAIGAKRATRSADSSISLRQTGGRLQLFKCSLEEHFKPIK